MTVLEGMMWDADLKCMRGAPGQFISSHEVCYERIFDVVLQIWSRLGRDWATMEVQFQLQVRTLGL